MHAKRGLPALAILLMSVAARAADPAALEACRGEADDMRRLACYDRAVGRESPVAARPTSATAQPAVPAATVAPPAAAAAAADSFGRERAMEREETQKADEQARELGSLQAVVSDISTRIDGLMTITLDNGQVWQQNRPDSRFRLKSGDPVTIQAAALHSFLMSGPSKRSTRVTRIK
jgi:hypothetical protein